MPVVSRAGPVPHVQIPEDVWELSAVERSGIALAGAGALGTARTRLQWSSRSGSRPDTATPNCANEVKSLIHRASVSRQAGRTETSRCPTHQVAPRRAGHPVAQTDVS